MASRRTPGTIFQFLILAVLAAGAVVVARNFYENPLPLRYAWSEHVTSEAAAKGMRTVSIAEAKQIADQFSHIILDARKASDFSNGRLPGAMSLPVSDFDAHITEVSLLLTPEQPIMVYCSGQECEESLELGEILITHGYTNITLFAGGISAWTEAGYSLER